MSYPSTRSGIFTHCHLRFPVYYLLNLPQFNVPANLLRYADDFLNRHNKRFLLLVDQDTPIVPPKLIHFIICLIYHNLTSISKILPSLNFQVFYLTRLKKVLLFSTKCQLRPLFEISFVEKIQSRVIISFLDPQAI